MSHQDRHPLLDSIQPLLEAIGASTVSSPDALPSDIPLEFEGDVIAAVRLPKLHGALDRLIESVEVEIGGRLADKYDPQKISSIDPEGGPMSNVGDVLHDFFPLLPYERIVSFEIIKEEGLFINTTNTEEQKYRR